MAGWSASPDPSSTSSSPRRPAGDQHRARVRRGDRGRDGPDPGRGGPAARRGPRPGHLHEADRRSDPRHRGAQHRPWDHRAGRRAGARPRVERLGRRPRRAAGGLRRDGAVGDPPPGAGVRRPRAVGAHVRDRHQGHRPADAVRGRRQDRPVRWCRRRQDGADHRDDQPGRVTARRRVGVRRRGRAHAGRHRTCASR